MFIVFYNKPSEHRQVRIGSAIVTAPSLLREYNVDMQSGVDSPFVIAETDAVAKHAAERMAQNRPTVEVCIAEVRFQFQSKTPEVVRKEVSSKGVLPA